MEALWEPAGGPMGAISEPYGEGTWVSSGRATWEPSVSIMGALREHDESHVKAIWEPDWSQTGTICELYGSYLRAL